MELSKAVFVLSEGLEKDSGWGNGYCEGFFTHMTILWAEKM